MKNPKYEIRGRGEGVFKRDVIRACRQSGKTILTTLAMTPEHLRPIMYEMFEREGLVSSKPVRYAKFKS